MYGRVIYVLGPEGVGKSIQACFLIGYFKKYFSMRAVSSEVRSNNLFMYLLSMFLIRCGRVEYYVYPGSARVARIDRLFMRNIIGLWLVLEALAFIIAHVFKITLVRFLGYTVVLTRHVVDFLTDMYALGFTCRRIITTHYLLSYILLRLFFNYDLVIYLDADYSTLIKRYVKRGSYIEPRIWVNFYRRISRKLLAIGSSRSNSEIYYVNTDSKDTVNVFASILSILHSRGLFS